MTTAGKQRVYLSIGSNVNREHHVRGALDALNEEFGELLISKVYESTSVGFKGDNFYNLVVGFDSRLSVGELVTILRAIEHDNGRRRTGERFGPRTLDIDILTYGNCKGLIDDIALPRDEILTNGFVLVPLADIAGHEYHPVIKQTYREMSDELASPIEELWPIKFDWPAPKT
jgi:2-amino-4-hydroxy-6-hydroxymethyldihydropteridine diphosphokinase